MLIRNGVKPSRLEVSFETHTKKDGTPIDDASAEAMVI